MNILSERSHLLQGLISNEAVAHKVTGERRKDHLLAERISSIIEGDKNLTKAESSHALMLDSVKKKVIHSKKPVGYDVHKHSKMGKVTIHLESPIAKISKSSLLPKRNSISGMKRRKLSGLLNPRLF